MAIAPIRLIYMGLFLAGEGEAGWFICFDEQTNTSDMKREKNSVLGETGTSFARSLVIIKLSAQISRQGRLAESQVAHIMQISWGGS